MKISVKKQYPAYYKKIKNLGYDTIEIRKLEPNLNLQSHFHPFTACMIILDGKVFIGENKTKYELKSGDFIAVERNSIHTEKTDKDGATVIYGKKFLKSTPNLSSIENNLNNLISNEDSFIQIYVKKSFASYILYLTLYKQYYSEKWLSQDEIINSVPKIHASRSTLINLINVGLSKGYIIKRSSNFDRRSIFYELSLQVFNELENMMLTKNMNK